jgi:hypothetical protein
VNHVHFSIFFRIGVEKGLIDGTFSSMEAKQKDKSIVDRRNKSRNKREKEGGGR